MSLAAWAIVAVAALAVMESEAPAGRQDRGAGELLVSVTPPARPTQPVLVRAGETDGASSRPRLPHGGGELGDFSPPPLLHAERDLYPRGSPLLPIVQAFRDGDLETALDVSWCESRYKASAQNAVSTAAGLFQFIESTWGWVRDRYVPEAPPFEDARYSAFWSALMAAVLVDREGWHHWECWG